MRIGEFARAGNVSVRTLRLYDAMGLLAAPYTHPSTGYRHYEPKQLGRLLQIRALQDLGFSLVEIHQLLRQDLSRKTLLTLMEERRSELKRRIREDLGRVTRIEERLGHLRDSRNGAPEISVRGTREVSVVSLREKIPRYDDAQEMFKELERRVGPEFLTGERLALWHACEQNTVSIDCEVVRCLRRSVAPTRGLRTYRLPAGVVASIFHCGSDETMGAAYKHLNRWLDQSAFSLRGAKREIYWLEADGHTANEGLTEIQYPVVALSADESGRAGDRTFKPH